MDTRFVRLEGQEERCLMVFPSGDVPEELVIDFDTADPEGVEGAESRHAGRVTFRLRPSSLNERQLIYVEVFDE